MDEVVISRAIVESYMRDFMKALEVDVAVVGAGPAGLVTAYYLAKGGTDVAVFEKQLRVGGGMAGGGMMFNRIVVQEKGRRILDEFEVPAERHSRGYYVADSLEAIANICAKAIKAGARIFNLIDVEDVMLRERDRITGLVLNWSAVAWSKLHVDPLTARCKVAVDATGHEADICRIVVEKVGPKLRTKTGDVMGQRAMWAEKAERETLENTREVYPGLVVAGMTANAVFGSPRMGAIFGGMLLSGEKAARVARELLRQG
jgi:thiazole biosynthesis enzyme